MAIRGLPRSLETTMFRTFVDVLRKDEVLSNVVETWRVWEGKRNDDAAPPAQEQMPWVRLTPQPARVQRAEVETYALALTVLVELAVGDTNVDDMLNLWGAIRSALIDTKAFRGITVGEAMRNAGCHFYEITQGATFPARAPNQDPPVADLRANATVVLSTFVQA